MMSLARSAVLLVHARRQVHPLAAAGVVAALAVAGCGGHGGSNGATTTKPMSAAKAIDLAAHATQHIHSLSARVHVAVASQSQNIAMSMDMQLKPSTLIHMTMSISGPSTPAGQLEEILTSKALYLKDSALTQKVGKPWVGITLAQLSSKSGINFASLLQNIENSNPENQVKFFAASKDVHVVGSQTINGVATTEYAGSYTPAAAIKAIPGGLRKLLGPMLRLMGSKPVTFHVWIDAQHLTRKAVIDETISGQSAVTSYLITSVNQPVHVTLPDPSQVAQFPNS